MQPAPSANAAWLRAMLARNCDVAYLRRLGSPTSLQDFRERVPPCGYEDIVPYLARIQDGAVDVLFAGRPVAYERTGGSSSGPKLIPYSRAGLVDIQNNVAPWLSGTLARHRITGSVYFAISPATRARECIGDVPVGLPDDAYLGELGVDLLRRRSAVPLEIGAVTDVDGWRRQTLEHLAAAADLELISVWSPTFLLRLLEDLPDAARLWPRLKVVSCWASGPAHKFAAELAARLPQATIQPKGLLSTEAVVTVPDDAGRPALAEHGFCEFAAGERLLLADELHPGPSYEVVVTTASGLYRYRTGDLVRCEGLNAHGRPVLDFVGRGALTSDLVGEKLNEAFVSHCLQPVPGLALLVPCVEKPGYVLVCANPGGAEHLGAVEDSLAANPQYAYARRIGQLAPLRALVQTKAGELVERRLLSQGVRLGDVKPLALRPEAFWLELFAEAA